MLLAIDIGNTNITIGLFDAQKLQKTWRVSTDSSRTSDEYGLQISNMLGSNKIINEVSICSVVPPLTPTFEVLCRRYFKVNPLTIGAGSKTGIKVMYDSPRDVGTDRIVDGGAIAPGMGVSADALFRATSQLRRVELSAPDSAIGKNTQHSIQSGLVLGYSELVKGMIRRFKLELGKESKVIATGGLAQVVEKEVSLFDIIDPDLTLKGLQIVHELNKDPG